MAKTNQERARLGVAGEYAVASELSKRGYDVTITLGNAKATDIIIFLENKEYRRIEVKTTDKSSFVTGFFQKYYEENMKLQPDYWVLVQIDKNHNNRYFILTHKEVAETQMIVNKMTSWHKIEKGCDNIKLSLVEQYENQWDKIK